MRTISDALVTAQKGTSKTPHIHIVINSVDYTSRLLFLEHHEEAYRDRATLLFRNNDRAFDDVDLRGYRFRIGYGFYTGNNVAEPDGDAAGNEYSYAADLWVKSQQLISNEGEVVCQLYCEGQWMYLREQRVMAYGSAPYYSNTFNATLTVYSLIEAIIETAMGWTLNATPSPDDGILNTFQPVFTLNEIPYEIAAEVLYRFIAMTKCYLRPKANLTWDIIYPQDSDYVNETYYSNQQHFFMEYAEKKNEIVPNRIVVFCNQDADGQAWTALITGDTGAYVGNYVEIKEPFLAASITTQANADARAAAILTRIKAESLAGRLVIPHDCGVELYDKVQVYDRRGY